MGCSFRWMRWYLMWSWTLFFAICPVDKNMHLPPSLCQTLLFLTLVLLMIKTIFLFLSFLLTFHSFSDRFLFWYLINHWCRAFHFMESLIEPTCLHYSSLRSHLNAQGSAVILSSEEKVSRNYRRVQASATHLKTSSLLLFEYSSCLLFFQLSFLLSSYASGTKIYFRVFIKNGFDHKRSKVRSINSYQKRKYKVYIR